MVYKKYFVLAYQPSKQKEALANKLSVDPFIRSCKKIVDSVTVQICTSTPAPPSVATTPVQNIRAPHSRPSGRGVKKLNFEPEPVEENEGSESDVMDDVMSGLSGSKPPVRVARKKAVKTNKESGERGGRGARGARGGARGGRGMVRPVGEPLYW